MTQDVTVNEIDEALEHNEWVLTRTSRGGRPEWALVAVIPDIAAASFFHMIFL